MKMIVRNILVPLLVLLLGVGVAASIISSAEPEAETVPETEPTRVAVQELHSVRLTASVQASGVVEAGQQLSLVPQVSGAVTWIHPELTAGGRLSAGEEILRIDPADYQEGLNAEQSLVSQATLELELESQRGTAAAREWALVKGDEDAESLTLREPHRDAAEKALQRAESGERMARLSLDRTVLVAPFDLVVVEESVDLGQVLTAGQPIASLVGTEFFHVRASIPVAQLAQLEIPGARARIQQNIEGAESTRDGTVQRLASNLDPLSHAAQIFIKVEHPLDSADSSLPLLVGSFVDVQIEGDEAEVIPVPRILLHSGQRVWQVDSDDLLQPVDLVEAWSDTETLYARGGLESGARVVSTPLSLPLAGQPVQVVQP